MGKIATHLRCYDAPEVQGAAMARQVRSEATRRKILEAAVDVFGEVGYATAGWATIIERTGMTKGALYHHFDSKESLAAAVIAEGSQTLLDAFRNVCKPSSPGLENMVHGTFTVNEVLSQDRLPRTAERLASALAGYNDAAAGFYGDLVAAMTAQARRAVNEGDLREGVDPQTLSSSMIGAIFGLRLIAASQHGEHSNAGKVGERALRLRQVWGYVLPGIVTDASLAYIQQFLDREAMRHATATAADGAAEGPPGAPNAG